MTIYKIKNLVRKLFADEVNAKDDSIYIFDQEVIEQFIGEASNPFLVSFPRTGSHWLRMVMELYFKRPSLVRIFYYPEITNYLTLHTHDINLTVERQNVIYLYRDPVDTVYSQLNYYKEDVHDISRIYYWSHLYGSHLDKWLHRETFTQKKTVLTYEGMKRDMEGEFRKIADHFGEQLDRKRLSKMVARITKEEVKKKTGHDTQVVQLKTGYADMRDDFRRTHGEDVWDNVLKRRPYLEEFFSHLQTNGGR